MTPSYYQNIEYVSSIYIIERRDRGKCAFDFYRCCTDSARVVHKFQPLKDV